VWNGAAKKMNELLQQTRRHMGHALAALIFIR
jgi:hypothetical protein